MLAQYNRDSIVRETVEAAPSCCGIRSGKITSDAGEPLLAAPCEEIVAEPKSWSIRATAPPCTSSARTLRTARAGPDQASADRRAAFACLSLSIGTQSCPQLAVHPCRWTCGKPFNWSLAERGPLRSRQGSCSRARSVDAWHCERPRRGDQGAHQ